MSSWKIEDFGNAIILYEIITTMSNNREYTPGVSHKVNLCRVSVLYAQYFSMCNFRIQ